MNYLKQILGIKSNEVDVEDEINNTVIYRAHDHIPLPRERAGGGQNRQINDTNKYKENADDMDIIDSNLISSDLSDAVSDNLASSTESLFLNDVCSKTNDKTSTNDKESLSKLEGTAQKEIVMPSADAHDSSNVNVLSTNEDITMNCINSNDDVNLSADSTISISENLDAEAITTINKNEDIKEIQVTEMDLDDNGIHNITEETLKPEQLYEIEAKAIVDDNNNTDILTQFIENNIADFVQTPHHELSEILSSMIEFDITPNNSCSNLEANNNDLPTRHDDYVLMDLDAIVDEIESVDAYIDGITNSHNMEDLNDITYQDIDNILNRNSNGNIQPLLSNINDGNTDFGRAEKPDFKLEIGFLDKYDFDVQVEVETVSSIKDNSSQDTDSVILIENSRNNSFVENNNDTDETVKPLDLEQTFADQSNKDSLVNVTTSPINNTQMEGATIFSENLDKFELFTETIMVNEDSNNNTYVGHEHKAYTNKKQHGRAFTAHQNSKETSDNVNTNIVNVTTYKQNEVNQKNRDDNAKIIDAIIISSSDDDEENIPLTILKKIKKTNNIKVKKINNSKITHIDSSHISISSNDSTNEDPDYCSGYESADFEFITESEAKEMGITIKDKAKHPPRKTLEIQRIERLNSENLVIEYYPNNLAGGFHPNFDYNNNRPGPSGLNNNANAPGPSDISNYKNKDQNYFKNKELNNIASTEDHDIPEGNEYLNLFQGMHERALRPYPYSLENKSVYEPNPSAPGMYIDMVGVGFDLAARQNQPYDDEIDDDAREEAREIRNRILELYPEDNKKRKRKC